MPDTRGTNVLALNIAREIDPTFGILAVLKLPHLVDPRIPYTHGNNSAVIITRRGDTEVLFPLVKGLMNDDFIEGSDPGLCVMESVPASVLEFGLRSTREVLEMRDAWEIAIIEGIMLEGLGGTEQGIIGALGGIGLAAGGEHGVYLRKGSVEFDIRGTLEVAEILKMGVEEVRLCELAGQVPASGNAREPSPGRGSTAPVVGPTITQGKVQLRKKLRPARIGGRAVVLVTEDGTGVYDEVRVDKIGRGGP